MLASDIRLEDYLLSTGHKPVRESGKYLFYLSPLRNENNASFLVRKTDGKWSDPGVKVRGRERYNWHSVLDYVMELHSCGIKEASRVLTGASVNHNTTPRQIETSPSIEIVSESELRNNYLIDYIKSRNVDIDIARVYTKQIGVRFPNSKKVADKVFQYIGFKTNKGSWELRNERMKVSSSPKYFTTIKGSENGCKNVFEGFFDFLSALTYWRRDRFSNETYVLNSLVNLTYIEEYLKNGNTHYMFLDNDQSADEKMEYLRCGGVGFKDMRHIYGVSNDFNDFICGKVML